MTFLRKLFLICFLLAAPTIIWGQPEPSSIPDSTKPISIGVIFKLDKKEFVPAEIRTPSGHIPLTLINQTKEKQHLLVRGKFSGDTFLKYYPLPPMQRSDFTLFLAGGEYEVIVYAESAFKSSLVVLNETYQKYRADDLPVDSPAPSFVLPSTLGNFDLATVIESSPVVLAFIPGAFRPLSSEQVISFQEEIGKLKKLKVSLAFVSCDSLPVLEAWAKILKVGDIPLISDNKKEITKRYQVLSEEGDPVCSLFIIDQDGSIRKIFKYPPNVAPRIEDLLMTLGYMF